VRSPTDLGLKAVLRGQGAVSDQAFLIIRDAEQSVALLRGQKLPALHTIASRWLQSPLFWSVDERCGIL
jgi:hypothetical protein